MLTYDQWFYRSGVRKFEFLANPPVTPLVDFSLPYFSLVHYLPKSTVEIGPSIQDITFQSVGGLKYVDHVLEQATQEGSPIWAKQTPSTFVNTFRKRNPDFRRMGKLELIKETRNALVIENYAILQHLWRYRDIYLTPYNRWVNARNTVWANVNRIYNTAPNLNQFVFMEVPQTIPSLQEFDKVSARRNRDTMAVFSTDELLDAQDLFAWAGPNRMATAMGKINEDALPMVNIVYQVSGYWCVLNLGQLNQWIKGEGIGTEREIEKGKDPRYMQKSILAVLNRLLTVRSTAPSDITIVEHTADMPGDTADTTIQVDTPKDIVLRSELDAAFGIDLPDRPDFDSFGFDFDNDDEHGNPRMVPDDKPATKVVLSARDLDDGSLIVKTFWDLDKPAMNLDEIIQPIVSEATKDHTDTLGQYEMGILGMAAEYHSKGMLTNAEFARFEELSGKYRTLTFDESGRTVADMCVIEPTMLHDVKAKAIPNITTVLDKRMLSSSLMAIDRNYIEKVLPRDVANAFMAPQRAGFALTAFSKTRVETVADKLDVYRVTYTPVDGERTSLTIPVPVMEADGSYLMNGTRSYLKKQRIDVPIRKVKPDTVALTSYYGRIMIFRSDKVDNSYELWLLRKITAGVESKESKYERVRLGVSAPQTLKAPRVYTIVSSRYRGFVRGKYEFDFDYGHRELFDKECFAKEEENYPIGWEIEGETRTPILVDRAGLVHRLDGTLIGAFEDLLDIPTDVRPTDVAEMGICQKRVPLGFILSYIYGIDELFGRCGVEPKRYEPTEKPVVTGDEFVIRFKDQTLVISRTNQLASLLFAGFRSYRNGVMNYNYEDFNGKDVYLNVLEAMGVPARVGRELENQQLLFIDHITRGILEDMGEPTEYGPLLVRSAQLLLTDYCPDETDMEFMRLAGYERIAGDILREFYKGIRAQRSKQMGRRKVLDISPTAVWRGIQSDGSSQIIEDSTPIHKMKEQEAVTYGGTGGRGTRTMVRSTRAYHKNDIGTISESTVASGAVAINTSTSSNPLITSLRGNTRRYKKEDGPTSLLSTSALMAPGSDHDAPNRLNFISTQNSSGIATEGYEVMPVGTGMESIIAHRAASEGSKFSGVSRGKGKITEITPESLTIVYDDPELGTDHIAIGLTHGVIAGMTVPHNLVTDYKVGDIVEEATVVARNDAFFEPDPMQPGQTLYKPAMLVFTMLGDGTDTLEDSSAISKEIGERMRCRVSYPKTVFVDPGQVIHNVVEVGTRVDLESILCSVEDAITANAGLFDDDSYDTLKDYSRGNPKAGVAGVVDKVVVYYNGDPETFNDSLAELIRFSDRQLSRRQKRLGGTGEMSGRVGDNVTIDGKRLQPGQAAIQVFITGSYPAGVGDKGVFVHQLKTTFGRIMTGVNKTEDDQTIDAIFGYASVSDRIVESPEAMGTTNTLCLKVSDLTVEAYRK
ncbi:hypothetical protein pEaSNUABM54_00083 [Erwinia phage pEa_SNUABM_54]|nr:hypothetical protein pEaSNUABM54_00083 [Erwinia phage pEa_SNUABM_54]